MGSADFVAFALTAREVAATGEAAGAGDTGLEENQGRLAGEGDGAAGDPAVAAVASFLLERFCLAGLGDAAAGDSAAAAVATEDADFFLECLGLAAVADASGFAVEAGV
jgi:hypothetical protein